MAKCIIFGALRPRLDVRGLVAAGDLVIAADGGYAHLAGVKPDLVVGDFDSLKAVPAHETIVRHPVRKDDTDLLLAVKIGLEKGYGRFVLLGALGGRLDQTVATFQTLAFLQQKGAQGTAISQNCQALLCDKQVFFQKGAKGLISAFAYGGVAQGVTLKGLSYPLDNHTLTPAYPLGVSNAFMNERAQISVKKGTLLLIRQTGKRRAKSWLFDMGWED